jgi:hypothetical protein
MCLKQPYKIIYKSHLVIDIQQMLISSFDCAYYFPYMLRLPSAIFRGLLFVRCGGHLQIATPDEQ